MMRYLLLLVFCCSASSAFACRCAPLPELTGLSQLKAYVFIAHVKITDDGDAVKSGGAGRLRFKVLELFKGKRLGQINELLKNTSCDMYISKGQEWILFGKMNEGKLSVWSCERSTRYHSTPAGEGAPHSAGEAMLAKLRELYRKRPVAAGRRA